MRDAGRGRIRGNRQPIGIANNLTGAPQARRQKTTPRITIARADHALVGIEDVNAYRIVLVHRREGLPVQRQLYFAARDHAVRRKLITEQFHLVVIVNIERPGEVRRAVQRDGICIRGLENRERRNGREHEQRDRHRARRQRLDARGKPLRKPKDGERRERGQHREEQSPMRRLRDLHPV